MTLKQYIKSIFEHMSKLGMLDDLDEKYPDGDENDETVRSEIGGTQ